MPTPPPRQFGDSLLAAKNLGMLVPPAGFVEDRKRYWRQTTHVVALTFMGTEELMPLASLSLNQLRDFICHTCRNYAAAAQSTGLVVPRGSSASLAAQTWLLDQPLFKAALREALRNQIRWPYDVHRLLHSIARRLMDDYSSVDDEELPATDDLHQLQKHLEASASTRPGTVGVRVLRGTTYQDGENQSG